VRSIYSTRGERGWDGKTDFRLQYENAILRESDLPAAARLVALALKNHCDADGHCSLLIETLAKESGLQGRTVRKHLAVLRTGGYLRSQRRRGALLFWIVIPQIGTRCRSDRHDVPTKAALGASLDGHEVPTEVDDSSKDAFEGVNRASGATRQKHRSEIRDEVVEDEPDRDPWAECAWNDCARSCSGGAVFCETHAKRLGEGSA
jgi:hypothetical protein